jgi:hypothetical protein
VDEDCVEGLLRQMGRGGGTLHTSIHPTPNFETPNPTCDCTRSTSGPCEGLGGALGPSPEGGSPSTPWDPPRCTIINYAGDIPDPPRPVWPSEWTADWHAIQLAAVSGGGEASGRWKWCCGGEAVVSGRCEDCGGDERKRDTKKWWKGKIGQSIFDTRGRGYCWSIVGEGIGVSWGGGQVCYC